MTETATAYPANLTIEYPEQSDRATVFFRLLLVIPIAIVLVLLAGHAFNRYDGETRWDYSHLGLVVAPTLLMILFRKKYPRWWFDWNLALTRFGARVVSYLLLLRDEYPSTDEEQSVHVAVPYPDAERDLMRGMPLVKWLLAIPHVFCLALLWPVVLACTLIGWVAILVSGHYPRDVYDFVVGVMRWSLRVEAYALLLTTDRYPPFGLAE
jgi:hypothetical protein